MSKNKKREQSQFEKRKKETGEFFTPPKLVKETLDYIPDSYFINVNYVFIDPTCGDGEFLLGVIERIRKVRNTFTLKDWKNVIKNQIYGVDLMWDNVCDTLYYLIRSFYIPKEEPILISSGFDNFLNSEEVVTKSPEEINKEFTNTRRYKDRRGIVEIRRCKQSKYFVEYRINQKGDWTQSKKIVRANSLAEWDFENWCPK